MSRWDWRTAGAGTGVDFEQRSAWDSNGSTWTAGAGQDTGDCRQACLQGGSAAARSVDPESMPEEGPGFGQEREGVGSCPWEGMRRQEEIESAGSGWQNPEEGVPGSGTGKPRPQRPRRPACRRETEGRGQSLRLASARCWRPAAAAAGAEAAAAGGGREHRRASRRSGRAGAM